MLECHAAQHDGWGWQGTVARKRTPLLRCITNLLIKHTLLDDEELLLPTGIPAIQLIYRFCLRSPYKDILVVEPK